MKNKAADAHDPDDGHDADDGALDDGYLTQSSDTRREIEQMQIQR